MSVLIPFLAILGVIVGWLLKEASETLRVQREERAALGRIVADLLEIRHNFLGVKAVRRILHELGMPPQMGMQLEMYLKGLMKTLLPHLQNLPVNYNKAVDVIAERNPVLAFRLRHQDGSSAFIDTVQTLAAS